MDVVTAFLYGAIDTHIYVDIPPSVLEKRPELRNKCCRLKKALYGLKQAPRIWYQTLRAHCETLGFRPVIEDAGIFPYVLVEAISRVT
jgi:hypothetical protein